jgi:hypothetical protein
MEQPLSFNSLSGDVPNRVCMVNFPTVSARPAPQSWGFRLFHFKSFAGSMATPAGQFIFMKKPSSNRLSDGRLRRAARGWWTGVLSAGLTRTRMGEWLRPLTGRAADQNRKMPKLLPNYA